MSFYFMLNFELKKLHDEISPFTVLEIVCNWADVGLLFVLILLLLLFVFESIFRFRFLSLVALPLTIGCNASPLFELLEWLTLLDDWICWLYCWDCCCVGVAVLLAILNIFSGVLL